jgi:hypothetical protein
MLYLSGAVSFSTGIFLTAARMFEPLFKLLVYKQIWQFWGEIYEPKEGEQNEEERQIANDSLSTFLTSSLNVELVFIILTSITAFADKDSTKLSSALNLSNSHQSNPLSNSRREREKKLLEEAKDACGETREHLLRHIHIEDVDKWNTAKAKDFITQRVTQNSEN